MTTRMTKRVRRALIEALCVAAATAVLFWLARCAGVAERGNMLWGGEIVVPVIVPALYYIIKGAVRDVRAWKE